MCNILKLLPNKKTFKTLKNVVSFSLGLCMEQLTFDLLKIFGLSSGSSRSSFRGRNTYTLSFGRLVLTNYKAENFFLKFNSGKIWKIPREKNFLDCLSKIYQFCPWCFMVHIVFKRLPWLLVLWLAKIDLQFLRNTDTYMLLPYTH